jgi:hypothetical protein
LGKRTKIPTLSRAARRATASISGFRFREFVRPNCFAPTDKERQSQVARTTRLNC